MDFQKTLVTGGAGFIGSHLVDELIKLGCQVIVLDNLSTGSLENLSSSFDHIQFIEGDIRDRTILNRVTSQVEVVFHQAAFVSVPLSVDQPAACFDTNVQGTVRLLEAARTAGVSRVVQASSAAVYGENTNLPLDETSQLAPLSPYAVSKQTMEIYGQLYSDVLGLEVVSLRYFNVYGPRQSPDSDYAAAIPIFTKLLAQQQSPVIYGDGHQSRDFIHVKDIARANIRAAVSPDAAGEIFNICSGEEISILDLVADLETVFSWKSSPQHQEPRTGDIYRSLGNPGKAARLLNFLAEIDLPEGLKNTAAYWLDRNENSLGG